MGFGICISLIGLVGLDIPGFIQLNINPNLVITFIIPPFFEAMMNIDYKQFKTIRISAILLASIGVVKLKHDT